MEVPPMGVIPIELVSIRLIRQGVIGPYTHAIHSNDYIWLSEFTMIIVSHQTEIEV